MTAFSEYSDQELTALLKGGGHAAYTELFKGTGRNCWQSLTTISGINLQIISMLPEKCRLVFQYSRDKGLKNSEIAEEMGIAEKTVEAHLSKAIKVIKDKLPDTGALMVILAELLGKK